MPETADQAPPLVAVITDGNRITCPRCGSLQQSNRKYCYKCGV